MKKKKQILSEEQKAQKKITNAKWHQENKDKERIYTEEQKAQKKITQAEWMANRSLAKVAEDKARRKIYHAKWWQDNKERQKQLSQEWYEANPGYFKEYKKEWGEKNPEKVEAINKRFKEKNPDYVSPSAVNLGYWIVYIITNYNGLGDDYCGQTQNIYKRMVNHKYLGKLNTDTYTIVKKCDTLEDALEIESAVHNFGYHGYNYGM